MMTALFIGFTAFGHMVRDGWPGYHPLEEKLGVQRWPVWLQRLLNPTQLARITGAAIAGLGALAVASWHIALLFGLAILAGFYADMKHGEGQGPDDTWQHTLHNVPYLALSGVTSLVPLAVLGGWFVSPLLGFIALVGLVKPVIWIVSWNLGPDRLWSFLQPTRVAATVFGAVLAIAFYFMQ